MASLALVLCMVFLSAFADPVVWARLPGGKEIVALGQVRAERKNDDPITYREYTVELGNSVPPSWLFVGTYLMSAKSVSARLYREALDSRDYYDQHIAFYTSELDQGNWKNVKDAESLANIMTLADTVEESTLYPYYITVVVGDDGIPRDPATGEPVDVYTLISLYDMENIKELDLLEEYYEDGPLSAQDTGTSHYLYRMLYYFFENDDLEYDRAGLDVGSAMLSYARLSSDRRKLEELWDQALTKSPLTYPEEYKDLMLMMRNWPNIRDDVTDRADLQEAALDQMAKFFQEAQKDEEADATMYVQRQVDATRRAEIYYNLLYNTNLTGSYGMDNSEVLEELEYRKAEISAEMAEASTEADKAQAPATKMRQEVLTMQDAIKDLEEEILSAGTEYAAADPEGNLAAQEAKLQTLEEELKPIETEYNRLDSALDAILNEVVVLNEEQQKQADEINALRNSKYDTKLKTYEDLEQLEKDLEDLKTRQRIAQARKPEYDEAVEEILELESRIARLENSILAETGKLPEMQQKADSYTSSRFTALTDGNKTYDPEAKTNADHAVVTQEKLIRTLEDTLNAAVIKKNKAKAIVDAVGKDLNLEKEIELAQARLDEANATWPDILNGKLQALDLEIAEKEEALEAASVPYQEKLLKLKAANDAFNAYEPVYLAKKEEIRTVKAAISDLQRYMDSYAADQNKRSEEITSYQNMIAVKEALIANAEAPAQTWQTKLSALTTEKEKIELLILAAQDTASGTPYDHLLEAYRNQTLTMKQEQAALEALVIDKEAYRLTALAAKGAVAAEVSAMESVLLTERPETYEAERTAIEESEDAIIHELTREKSDIEEEMRLSLLELTDYHNSIIATRQAEADAAMDLADRASSALNYKLDLDTKQAAFDRVADEHRKWEDIYREKAKQYEEYTYAREYFLSRAEKEKAELDYMYSDACPELIFIEDAKILYEGVLAIMPEFTGETTEELTEFLESCRQDYTEKTEALEAAKEAASAAYTAMKAEYTAKLDTKQAEIDSEKAKKLELLDAVDAAFDEDQAVNREALRAKKEVLAEADATYQGYVDEIASYNTRISELISHQADLAVKSEEIKKLIAAFPGNNSFGIAPTLKFLQEAAEDGSPTFGRRYRDIAVYDTAESFEADAELNTIINYCMGQCAVSYEAYVNASMKRGETAADYVGFILSRKTASLAPDEEAALPYLQMITDLLNITEKKDIVHSARELSLLYGWLLPFAATDFLDKRTVDSMDDYHFYIQAVADREQVEDAITFVSGRLEYAYSVRSDFIYQGKTELIDAHIAWLENLLKRLRELAGLDMDEEYLTGADAYLEEYEKALEEGNLARARQIMDLLDGLINSGRLKNEMGSAGERNPDDLLPTDSDPDKRPLPEEEIAELIYDSLEYTDYDITPDLIRYNAAEGDLGDLLNGLEKRGAGPDLVNAVTTARTDIAEGGTGNGSFEVGTQGGTDVGGTGDGGGSSSSDGHTADTGKVTDKETLAVLSKLPANKIKAGADGKLKTAADDADAAAVVAEVAEIAALSDDSDLWDYLMSLLDDLLNSKNVCVYRKYMDDLSREYVSLGAVDKCRVRSGFRYVRKQQEITMTQIFGGSASYSFTVGGDTVLKNNGQTAPLEARVVEQTDAYLRSNSDTKYGYISEEDAQRYLGCTCVYIPNSDWAILVTPGMEKIMEGVALLLQQL